MLDVAYISSSRTVRVSGEAARTNGGPVDVLLGNFQNDVLDNNVFRALVDPDVVFYRALNVDLSGITNAGARLYIDDRDDNRLTGTAFDDFIRSAGAGRSTVSAGAGDDRIEMTGYDSRRLNDSINGGSGNDWIDAGLGDDSIRGGYGDDTLLGGDGVDVVHLYGDFSEYVLEIVEGDYRLTHLGGGGVDGVDLITNVEFLQFRDQRVALDPIPSRLAASYAQSSRTLFVSGEAARPGLIEVTVVYQSSAFFAKVYDTNLGRTPVMLETGDVYNGLPFNYDFSAVTGAGIYLSTPSEVGRIIGSNSDDRIIIRYGRDKCVISGGAGDDEITTDAISEGTDSINGGRGDDTIRSGAGDDSLRGSYGNDRIDGGLGIDTLHLMGDRSEYTLELVDGDYRLVHNSGSGVDGIDIVANVEFLQFRDQRVAIDPDVSALRANYDRASRTAQFSGDAAVAGGDQIVILRSLQGGTSMSLDDNDFGETRVSIDFGRQFAPTVFDFSGITNAGVRFSNFYFAETRIIGTAFNDDLSPGVGKSAYISGGGGDDVIQTYSYDDSINGGTGNDTIRAGGGDDTIRGGRGDDAIDGGGQTDTLYLYGNRAEYALDMFEESHRLTHLGGSGIDGTDLFINIEYLQFADQRVAVGDWMMA